MAEQTSAQSQASFAQIEAALMEERRQRSDVEASLRESEQLYRAVVEHSADAIVISVEGLRVFVNQAFLSLHGLQDASQAIGLSADWFVAPEDKPRLLGRSQARKRGEPVPSVYEYRILRLDGETRTVEASSVPVTYQGQPAQMAVIRDITARKLAEDALRQAHGELEERVTTRTAELFNANAVLEQHVAELRRTEEALRVGEERLARIVETNADGILMVDPSGHITFANAAAERILGTPRQLIIQREWPDPAWHALTVDGRLLSRSDHTPTRALSTGDPIYGLEFSLDRPDGVRIIVLCNIAPLRDASGAVGGLVLSFSDVSAQKELEAQSRMLGLLEERERITMDLHDGVIQSLYGVSLRLGALALEDRRPEHSVPVRNVMVQIQDVIKEIRNYIFDLRPHHAAGRGLRAGLEALVAEVEANTNIRVELAVDPAVEQVCPTKAVAHLLQVARESISNVVRHAGASAVRINLSLVGKKIVLTVNDDGRGFMPQGDGARRGQGLGNMAARAQAMGGHLSVTSASGTGTQVRLDVPAAEREVVAWAKRR